MSRTTIAHDAILIINQKRKDVGIFLIITLTVLIVLIVFPIRLMALSVIKINNEIESKKQIKEQLDTKISNLTQLNTEYQEIKEGLKDLALVFPNQGDYSLLVANIDEVCKANYFRLSSVNVESVKSVSSEKKLPFQALNRWSVNITVMGRKNDLVKLFEDIESMPMYPTVVSIGYKNEFNEQGFLTFNISLQIYGVTKPGIYLDI